MRWVVQTNLVWMPVCEQLRRSLRPGMLVGVAGDSKWYKLLGIAVEGRSKVSYKNKAKVQYKSIALAQVRAAKIERLTVLEVAKHSRTMLIDKNWHTRNDFARGNLLQVGGSVAK